MKVSIITACYNSEKTIEETIRSVARQTYRDIEYILVDGGSNDKTLEIIKKYKDKISILISEKDSGVYNAMNKGIKASTGEILFFLNSDDVFINELVVQKFVEASCKTEAGLILGDILLLNKYTGEFYYENHSHIDKIRLINSTVFHPATFFKSKVFEKYGFYNENNKIISDYEWYLNYFLNKGDYQYIKIPISIFSLGGISSEEKNIMIHISEKQQIQRKYFSQKEIKIVQLLIKFFPRKINKLKFRRILAGLGLNKFY